MSAASLTNPTEETHGKKCVRTVGEWEKQRKLVSSDSRWWTSLDARGRLIINGCQG